MMEDNKVDDRNGGESHQKAAMTDRVNVEPPILNGMTATEAKIIAGVATAFWGVMGGLVAAIFNIWPILIVSIVVFPIMTLWIGSIRLAAVKRGRPDGYYGQAIQLWAVKRGLGKNKFISHDGYWDIGVTSDFDLASKLDVDTLRPESFAKHGQFCDTEPQQFETDPGYLTHQEFSPVHEQASQEVEKVSVTPIDGILKKAKAQGRPQMDQKDSIRFAQSKDLEVTA